jgi:hypothetical protein
MKGREEDVDLLMIFNKIKTIFRGFLLVLFSKRRIFFYFFIAGIAAGIIYISISKKQYYSQAGFHTQFYPDEFCRRDMETLNSLIEEGSYSQVAAMLRMPIEETRKLARIRYSNKSSEPDSLETSEAVFQVEAYTLDNGVLANLQKGITWHLSNNPYVKKRQEVYLSNLNDRIRKTEAQLSDIDSLKGIASESLGNNSAGKGIAMIGAAYEPLNVYRESQKLSDELIVLKNELALFESVEIIQPFIKYNKPALPDVWFILITCAASSLVLAFIYVISGELITALNKLEKKKGTARIFQSRSDRQSVQKKGLKHWVYRKKKPKRVDL